MAARHVGWRSGIRKKKVSEVGTGKSSTESRKNTTAPKSDKITGHWGEDAVGFRWTEQDSVDDRLQKMDVGRFYSATIATPKEMTIKGIAVRIGEHGEASVLFDTELLRFTCGWTGDFLRFDPARYGIIGPPRVGGDVAFHAPRQPGWSPLESQKTAVGSDGSRSAFPIPLAAFPKHGPLPRKWAKYRGLHLHGNRVAFKYSVGPSEIEVLESPWLETLGGKTVITRELEIAPSTHALELLVADPGTKVTLVCEPNVATLEQGDGQKPITAKVAAHDKPVQLKFFFPTKLASTQTPLLDAKTSETLREMLTPGPAHWPQNLQTRGVVSKAQDALVVDTLTLPFDNPWKALLFVSGHDFFVGPPSQVDANARLSGPAEITMQASGAALAPGCIRCRTGGLTPLRSPVQLPLRVGLVLTSQPKLDDEGVSLGRPTYDAAICTLHGDVWLVGGIDSKLEELTWKRFATGMFQPLGLKIVNGLIHVLGRDQITRLHDLNGDGEADYYENFNNDGQVTTNGHEYATCLETDSQGRFYFLKGNAIGATEHDGCLLRVSPDGRKLEVVATGLRNANGLGVGLKLGQEGSDIFTVAPQEGEWTPGSAIFEVTHGDFYGYVPSAHRAELPKEFNQPLCWIPRLQDNSCGGQVWVPSGQWGPLAGSMLHLSYGTSRMFVVLREPLPNGTPNVRVQGATVPLALSFESGVMRGRFNPSDQHLYVSGLRGWVSNAAQDGCLQRVRFTGRSLDVPVAMKAFANGVLLKFTDRLDPTEAADPDNFRVQQWNYRWSAAYGSPELKVSNPAQEGRDDVEVTSSTLVRGEQHDSVFLELPHFQPVNQLSIQMSLKSRDGRTLERQVDATIHATGRELFPLETSNRPTRRGLLTEEQVQRLVPGLQLSWNADGSERTPPVRLSRLAAWHFDPDSLRLPSLKITTPTREQETGVRRESNSSPANRVSVGGYVVAPRKGTYRFSLEGTGPAGLTINGRALPLVADSVPRSESSKGVGIRDASHALASAATTMIAVELVRGHNSLRLSQDIVAGQPSVARLLWSSDWFDTEPIPPTSLFTEPLSAAASEMERGRDLFIQHRCSRCHQVSEETLAAPNAIPEFKADTPDLTKIGDRLRAEWMFEWLLDPTKFRLAPSMPSLFPRQPNDAHKQQAADVVAFLVRSSAFRRPQPDVASEIKIKGPPEGGTTNDDAGAALWRSLGCVACHQAKMPTNNRKVTDNWNRLSLGHVDHKFAPRKLAEFLQHPQSHFAWSHMPDFELTAEESQSLGKWLTREASATQPALSNSMPNGDAERGRELFATLGCRQCHRMTSEEKLPVAHLPNLFGRDMLQGCLADNAVEPTSGARAMSVPRFRFTDADHAALRTTLRQPDATWLLESPATTSRRMFADLRCFACHARDGRPALLPEILSEESDDGRPPEALPNLTWVGEKLHLSWTTELLKGQISERPRPWLKAHMPSFPARAALLANGFAHEHGLLSEPELPPSIDPQLAAIGEALATRAGLLDCRQCHAIGSLPPTGDKNTLLAPGINFAHIRERVRHDFYRRFTLDPPRYDVTTRMPKLVADGKTTKVKDIFDGDARRQFEAVWQFLHTVPNSSRDP